MTPSVGAWTAGGAAQSGAAGRVGGRRRSLSWVAAHAGLLAVVGAGGWLAVASASDNAIVDTSSAAEPGWAHGLLAWGLPGLTDTSFSLLLLVMLAGYVAAVRWSDALPERGTLAAVGAAVVLFGLAPPLLSSDIFGYVAYARLDVLHGINPYLHGPIAAPHDAVLPFVYWRRPASPYGPWFTLLSLPAGAVSVAVGVWSIKAASALACLVAVFLVVRAAPAYGQSGRRAGLVVGANPLLLVYGVGGGHNDLLVMAAAAGAILVLARDRRAPAGAALLVLATGLKVTGALLLPFALAASRVGVRFAAGALTAGVITAGVAVAAFGPDLGGTIGQIATSGSFVMPWSGPDSLGRLLGTGLTGEVRLACGVGAAVIVGGCLWRVRRGGDWLGCGAVAGVAVLAAIPSLVPWYVAWVLPAAALARGRGPRAAVVVLTAVIVVTHLPILGFDAY